MTVDRVAGTGRRPGHRLAGHVQLLGIWSGRGPLRHVWGLAVGLVVRLVALYLRRGVASAVYVKGSLGRGEPVFGLSDIGVVAIVGDAEGQSADACRLLRRRWRDLRRWIRPLSWIINDVPVYYEPEVPELAATCFRYGLSEVPPRPLFRTRDRSIRLATLPGLWPTQDWALVSGPDLRPQIDAAHPDQRRLAILLELQFWWRLAFRAAATPEAHWAPHLCVKLVAEPGRILLWLEHGEQHLHRVEILRRMRDSFPEETIAIDYALALRERLHRVPVAPLPSVLPSFARLSARIVNRLTEELVSCSTTAVDLGGLPTLTPGRLPPGTALPLCDWRALVRPAASGRRESFEPSFVIEAGRVDDLAVLEEALTRSTDGCYVTLIHDGLIVRPSNRPRHAFHSVGFPASDPVSAALADGRTIAHFPDVPGWSVRDVAARAVAEHREWLWSRRPLAAGSSDDKLRRHLAGIFSAARAAQFMESVVAGNPSLPVTFAAAADALAERRPAEAALIADAYGRYSAGAPTGGAASETGSVNALARVVSELEGLDPRPIAGVGWRRKPGGGDEGVA